MKLGDLIILKMCVIVLMLGWYLIIDMVLICFGCKKWEERRGMERRGGERKWERKRVNLNLFSLTWNYPFFPYVFPLSSFPLLSFPFMGKGSWWYLRNVIVTMCLAIFDYVRSEDMIIVTMCYHLSLEIKISETKWWMEWFILFGLPFVCLNIRNSQFYTFRLLEGYCA